MSTLVHHKRKFFDYFPTPKFLEIPSVGIDISDQTIRFVEIVQHPSSRQHFFLKFFGEKKISNNNPEEIIKNLVEIRKKYGFKFADVSLPEEKGYLFKMEMPNIEEKYFAENIELHLEENVPVDPTKSVFDYRLTQSHDNPQLKKAFVTVVPEKIIDTYLDLFNSASVAVISYDLVTQAVARAVVPQGDMETCLIVHIGDVKTGFGIVSDGTLQFTSTINIGHASNQAEIEKSRSLLRDEIVKLKTYWLDHSENQSDSVSRVILSGKDAAVFNLKEYLANAVGCRVDLANVWVNVFDFNDQVPEMSLEDSLDYAPAIGLALSRFYHA